MSQFKMHIIPAIDIKNKKCVRLTQGLPDQETVYSDNPIEVAKKWASMGAKWLHIVDLDGAFKGEPVNLDILKDIIENVNIPVELGGGLRTEKIIEKVFNLGVRRAILGTVAIENTAMVKSLCKKYKDKIAVGIDSENGKVAIKGWLKKSNVDSISLAKDMVRLGVKTLICTDIKRDGMLQGPNIDYLKQIAENVDAEIIASGGISTIDDVRKIAKLEEFGVTGMIIGKALYAGSIDFKKALAILNSKTLED